MKPAKTAPKRAVALFIAILMNSFSILGATTASQLIFTAQPASTVVGAGITNVVVQLADKTGTNVAQSGVMISLALNKSGLTGKTNITTDASGKAAFTNLKITLANTGDTLMASASGLKSVTSSAFNVSKGSNVTTLAATTNFLTYGQSITFTATLGVTTPASGTATLNASEIATFSTNRISAANASHSITAVYAGDANFSTSTSSNLSLAAGKLALTVSGLVANNKIYDGTTNATLNFSNATLATILSGDVVTLSSGSAKGTFPNKIVGTGKTVSTTGLALADASAGNYSITQPTATASITARALVITAKGANKIYDGTTNATATLTDNRVTGDSFTNSYASALFTTKNVGTAILINVYGLTISGTDAGNYALSNLTATTAANITPVALTISGILASNKIYDATTTAALNFSNAILTTILASDAVTLNYTSAKGAFASKTVGNGKTVSIAGLALAGTNTSDYTLTSPITTTANIVARGLTLIAKGVNKIYDGTTNATVTLTDNHVAGDAVTDSYTFAAFTNKNVGTAITINVFGLASAGNDSTNYVLTATNTTASANITKATLTVSGVGANNKIYDATTTATLNFSNAALVTVFSGDTVTLNTAVAKGVFASKIIGTNKTVTVSGLTISGVISNNYALTQPTATANITPRTLVITAKGVNKIYDGMTNATVTLTDNRATGDVVTDSYASAAFVSKNVATNILINVYSLAIAGSDSGNYNLSATNTTTTANITTAALGVTANNLSRSYGVTNPILTAMFAGFVAGESWTNSDVVGSPALTTTAKTNSNVGTYPITISTGSLVSVNYKLSFTNGVLTLTPASTSALISTTLNPALTNQNITFAAQVKPLATSVWSPTGLIQFKCNGTNKLGSAISIASGAANMTIVAASLGQNNAVITAEYSDPAGNFSPSTNSLTQTILVVTTPPPPSKLSLAPSFVNGIVTAQLSGVAGQTYVIEASADLIHWTALSTNLADTTGIVSLVDSNAAAYPSRFYRAYSP